MDRDFTPAVVAEVVKPLYRARHLVTVYLDDYTIRVTDADRTIVWNGETWLATGALLALGDVSESGERVRQSLSVTLSGVDQIFVSVFLSEQYLRRRIHVHRVFLNDRNEVILEPSKLMFGTIDEPILSEDPDNGTSQLTLQVVSRSMGIGCKVGRHTNNSEQQIHFPGDCGFKFVSAISRDVPWGRQ
jgi:hypothetical protein